MLVAAESCGLVISYWLLKIVKSLYAPGYKKIYGFRY